MAMIAVSTGGIALWTLYGAAYQEQTKRLADFAKSQARWIAAIGEHESQTTPPDLALQTTIEKFRKAHNDFQGLGRSGEFVIAQIADDHIQFLLVKGQRNQPLPKPVPLANTSLAEPMRLALANKTGVVEAQDYQGTEVVAAYVPVETFHLGLVAKMHLDEFEAPFVRAGLISAAASLVLIVIGTLAFAKVSGGLILSAEKNASQLETILNTIVDGVVSINENGQIAAFNAGAEKMFGYHEAEVIGKNIRMLMPAEIGEHHHDYMKNYRHRPGKITVIGMTREVTARRKDGSTFPIDIAIGRAKYHGQTVFTGIIRDITDRRRTESELQAYRATLEQQVKQRTKELAAVNRKLKQLAREDALTGIANRRVFDESIGKELRRMRRTSEPLSLIICDIDFFKKYNDAYGHVSGDECLQQVAAALQQSFQRAGELVARYGGEEFAVVLPGIAKSEAMGRAEHLRQLISSLQIEHKSSDISDHVTISLGVATVTPPDKMSAAQLIEAADQALYNAKRLGRDRVEANNGGTPHAAAS
jgi:diguanylate cyclase (GGDEF)-like protein/PAS domain S-box-containing protein